jgi:hypothetical protein
MAESETSFPVVEDVDFEVGYAVTEADAMRGISRALSNFRQTQRAPTVVVIESPMVSLSLNF